MAILGLLVLKSRRQGEGWKGCVMLVWGERKKGEGRLCGAMVVVVVMKKMMMTSCASTRDGALKMMMLMKLWAATCACVSQQWTAVAEWGQHR